MKKSIIALAVSACGAVASPVSATTFPSLTTIYIIPGVKDSGGGPDVGVSTVIQCSNVSGVSASVRFLLLNQQGGVTAFNTVSVPHGATVERATHPTKAYLFEFALLGQGGALISASVLNIESTQSGVFCTAAVIDAAATVPTGVPLHIVRVNPNPGTVE